MTKRWKYRKVTPAITEEMKELRKKGWTYVRIGKKFKVDPHTVRYWIDTKYHKKCISRAKARIRKPLTEEQKLRRRKYIREYINKRYTEDEEFKQRFKKHAKKWQDKRKKKLEGN